MTLVYFTAVLQFLTGVHEIGNGRERHAWPPGNAEVADGKPYRRLLDERDGLGGKGRETGAYVRPVSADAPGRAHSILSQL